MIEDVITNTVTAVQKLKSPIGTNLDDSATRSLQPITSLLAYNSTDDSVYYGSGNVWKALVTGPNIPVTIGSFSNTSNANGLSLNIQTLSMNAADGTNPGGVSTGTQHFAGVKLFDNGMSPMNKADDTGDIPSVPGVTHVMTNFSFANFPSPAAIFGGCIVSGSSSIALTDLPGGPSVIGISQYLPGPGIHPAGLITITFPASANPNFPGAMPLEWAPDGDGRSGVCRVLDGGVVKTGAFAVDPNGFLTIGSGQNPDGSLIFFTADGDNGLFDGTLTYFSGF